MWTREGQNMFELRISDSSSSIIFDQCSHRYSRSGYSQMSTNKNLYGTVLLAKILTTCKISLSFFYPDLCNILDRSRPEPGFKKITLPDRSLNNWMIQTISSLLARIVLFWIIFNFLSTPHFLPSWTFLNRWKKWHDVRWDGCMGI